MVGVDVHTAPALAPPTGILPDFVNSYSRAGSVIVTAAICLTCTTSFLAARLFTKVYVMRQIQIEDYALVLAQAGHVAFTGVMLAAGGAGQGRHQWNVSIANVGRIALLANIQEVLYGPVIFAAKLAALVQIGRIFWTNKFIQRAVQVLIAANFFVYFSLFFVFVFACWPRSKIQNPNLPGKCISTNGSINATAGINVVSDFTILFLPLAGIARLQMPLKQKSSVGAVFGTGLLACIASTVRLVYSVKLTQTQDTTWVISSVALWALVEFATVILVGCLPVIPRLYRFLRGQGATIAVNPVPIYRRGSPHPNPPPRRVNGAATRVSSGPLGDRVPENPTEKYNPLEDHTLSGNGTNLQYATHAEGFMGFNPAIRNELA